MSCKDTPHVLLFLGSGFEDLEAVTIIDVCGWTAYRDHYRCFFIPAKKTITLLSPNPVAAYVP